MSINQYRPIEGVLLVAEDDSFFQMKITRALSGYNYVLVEDGEEAIKALTGKTFQQVVNVDDKQLVPSLPIRVRFTLLDIEMPKKNGFEVMEAVDGRRLNIVAHTTCALSEEVLEKCGFKALWKKDEMNSVELRRRLMSQGIDQRIV